MSNKIHPSIDQITYGIKAMLRGKKADTIETQNVPHALAEMVKAYNQLAICMSEIMDFILPLAGGDLNLEPPKARNVLASPFKELHSRLRHLVWQAEQVTRGDYKQRIDFMGDFSKAFNSMVESLENKDQLLNAQIQQLTWKTNYLSLHDPLTKLYNRTYFEQMIDKFQMEGVPVGIMVCDVDGLKLINDTLGHDTGDKILKTAAEILHQAAGPGSIVSRIGGDEFTIILPEANHQIMKNVHQNIKDLLRSYKTSGNVHLSLAIGYTTPQISKNVKELFKEADNYMYRDKLLRKQSARSSIVETIMQMLKARDYITEGHANRVEDLVYALGLKKGLSQSQLQNLRLLAKFHDIGKVGIPDAVLNKPGPLTEEEMALMRGHSDIGRRICLNIPELSHIADLILKHHEWWNGSGYPLGLRETDIPIECRILVIVDAFDAMTNDRPYRKALNCREAIQELRRGAGLQFDPHLVGDFVDLLNAKSEFDIQVG